MPFSSSTLPLLGDETRLAGFFDRWALTPVHFASGENRISILTSMFLYGGLLHLAGNMLFLWIFGDNLEDSFGHLGFLAFYLACGVAAALAQVVPAPTSTVPMVAPRAPSPASWAAISSSSRGRVSTCW